MGTLYRHDSHSEADDSRLRPQFTGKHVANWPATFLPPLGHAKLASFIRKGFCLLCLVNFITPNNLFRRMHYQDTIFAMCRYVHCS